MKTKRITALLLSILMLSSSMLSCSEEAAETPESGSSTPIENSADENETVSESAEETVPEETAEPELMDSIGEANYDGYNFRISSAYYNGILGNFMTAEEMTGDPLNDTLYESNQYLCDRFNIDISIIDYGEITPQQEALRNSVAGGTVEFDVALGHDLFTVTLMKEGCLARLDTVENFDFSQPWWPANITDAFTINGRMYLGSNYASYSGIAWASAVIYNKDHAKDLKITIPYDTVREGKWTLDTFYSLFEGTSRDLDGNGIIERNDFWGFASGGGRTFCLQDSCGINLYPKDADGNLYFNADMERITMFVEKIRNIMGTDYIDGGAFSMGQDIFELGNTLFVYTQLNDAYTFFREKDFSYGFLPSPKLNELQEEYISAGTDALWGIPKTIVGDQLDITTSVLEAMSCYNYKRVIPAYFEVTLKTRLADSPDDAEMLQIVADTRTNSHAYTYQLMHRNLTSDYVGTNKEPASVFQASAKAAQITLERFVNSVLDNKD